MKRKTLLKLTACGLVGALTIGNFTVAAYAANCWSRKPCFRYCNNIICTDCRIFTGTQ